MGRLKKKVDAMTLVRELAAQYRHRKRPKKGSKGYWVYGFREPGVAKPRLARVSTDNKTPSKSESPSFQAADIVDIPTKETLILSKSQLDEEHETIITNIKALTAKYAGKYHKCSSHQWQSRRERESNKWDSVRDVMHEALLSRQGVPYNDQTCVSCSSSSVTARCVDCNYALLCTTCDQECHTWQPLHRRQFIPSTVDHFECVPACCELQEEEEGLLRMIHKEKYLQHILPPLMFCQNCNEETIELRTWGSLIVVTMKGRFDLFLPQYVCSGCNWNLKPSLNDIISIGYWPGNSKVTPGMYIFHEDVLSSFDYLKKEKPGLSIRAWLSMLEYQSLVQNRVGRISQKVFSEALREWQRCQFYLSTVQKVDLMNCPACFHGMHACHCDGNRKVYRFQGKNQYEEENYYKDIFVADDNKVNDFVNTVKSTSENIHNDQCGQSHWQAARTTSKSMQHLAETGLVVACCRHNIMLKAVNMFQGEIFAYPLFLQQELALKYDIEFFCQDVICKYWPWFHRIKQKLNHTCYAEGIEKSADMKPFLSIMHAKSHDWTCQILWGGKWQDGAAKTTGEEMEQCNSYFSTTGATTKNMGKCSREEQLTLHALHWNAMKRRKLPLMLMKWLVKSQNLSLCAVQELEAMKQEEIPEYQITQKDIVQWHQEIRKAAQDSVQGSTDSQSDTERYFLLHMTNKLTQNLQPFVQNLNEGLSIVMDSKSLRSIASAHMNDDRPDELLMLKERLTTTTGLSEEELLVEGRYQAVNKKSEQLRKEIELLHTSIKIKHHNIHRLGDSGSHRHRLRRKLLDEKKKLDKVIQEYNSILPLMRSPSLPVSEEMKVTGRWPWFGQNNGAIPLDTKRKLVEKSIEVARNQEEVKLVEKEICAMVDYYQKQLHETEQPLQVARTILAENPQNINLHRVKGELALLSHRRQDIMRELQNLALTCSVELETSNREGNDPEYAESLDDEYDSSDSDGCTL